MKVGLKRLANGHDLALPHYATAGAAGLDLLAAIEGEIEMLPGRRAADSLRHRHRIAAWRGGAGASPLRDWRSITASRC